MVGVLFTLTTFAQIGSIKAETYQSEFERNNLLMMYPIMMDQ